MVTLPGLTWFIEADRIGIMFSMKDYVQGR